MPISSKSIGSAAGRINGAYGEADWTPIRYINRAYSHSTLAGLYRAARVGLVTPLRDGMNLVAKEYVASQNPDDPGVLILSRFAGAAQECKAALLVNPYDPDSVAVAIGQALSMPLPSGASGTTRCSGCSHTTTSNIGPAAFLPSWNVSRSLQAGSSKCPLWDCNRKGERCCAWAKSTRDPLRLGQRNRESPKRGGECAWGSYLRSRFYRRINLLADRSRFPSS